MTSQGKLLIGSYVLPKEKYEFQRWCVNRGLTVSQGIRLLISRRLKQAEAAKIRKASE